MAEPQVAPFPPLDTPDGQHELRELGEWRRRLGLLLDRVPRFSAHRDWVPLLQELVDAACAILQAERATVFLLDPAKRELWAPAASGQDGLRVPCDAGIVGESVAQNRLINIADAYADRRFNRSVDGATGFRTRNLLTAPMANARGEILGALQILNKVAGAFSREDERMLVLFAQQAGAAVENARLYEQLRASARDTIFRLAAAAEFKDRDTRNHLERVSRYSALLAREAGRPEEWCRNLFLASPMHDIGKIGVPDAVLTKPGKLDDREWDEMRRHPMHGARILSGSDNELLRMSERIARSHHEKWDGSGYPDGLAGEAIPLEARIVALADVFDALTSQRCYKPAFTLDDALHVIRDGRGKHFDPDLVPAFERALPKIVAVMRRFSENHGPLPHPPTDDPLNEPLGDGLPAR